MGFATQKHFQRVAGKQETPATEDFYAMSYEQRKAMRRAAEQGKREAKELVKIEEKARRQAEYDATPEHLRRPENIYHKLTATWERESHRPEAARRIKEYKRLAAARDREIEEEMAYKLRRFEIESNPETGRARVHWETASAGAVTEQERREWARLKGLIDGGGAANYWQEAGTILNERLETIRQRMDEQIGKQAAVVGETKAVAADLAATEELAKATDPVESGEPTQQTGENQ